MADIRRDFTKFIKDFPVDIIPHTSDEELQERNRKHKAVMLSAIRRNPKDANTRRSVANRNDASSAYGGVGAENTNGKLGSRLGSHSVIERVKPSNFT